MNTNAVIIFVAIGLMTGCQTGKQASQPFTFYEVPLVCDAAPEIGCGSRSKPAMMEMEKQSAIKEVWLNRSGTVYAIVWADSDKTDEVAKPIFEKFKIDFRKLKDDEAESLLLTFRESGKWYRGAEVDTLSIEEAGVIANDAVAFARNADLITETEAHQIRPALESHLKTELVKVRSPEELYGDWNMRLTNELVNIIAGIVGKERAEKMYHLYMQKRAQGKDAGSCCSKQISCCSKARKH